MLVGIIQKYLQYENGVIAREKHVGEQTFPAVTICNLNPVRYVSIDLKLFVAIVLVFHH